jgi:hypothetical protein
MFVETVFWFHPLVWWIGKRMWRSGNAPATKRCCGWAAFSLSMQLEFHQLDRRWEHLRVRHPARQRRLLASLAESGQHCVATSFEAVYGKLVYQAE